MRELRTRLPTPYVFILWLRSMYWQDGTIEMMMTYLGIAVSYNYGLRSSEYTHDDANKGEQAIRTGDVFFTGVDGRRYYPWQLSSVTDTEISSGMLVNVSSKTLSDGIGRDLFLARGSPVESQLLDDLLHWSRISGIQQTDIFFARYKDDRGRMRKKQLTPKMVSAALKDAAILFGLPSTMFSTHCNRIGCASDLAAYGLHDDDIKRFIGWKSDASLLYQRGSAGDPSALRAEEIGGTLSISDVASLVPISRSSDLNTAAGKRTRVEGGSTLHS